MRDAQLKKIGTLEDICPYCFAPLNTRPQRKTKCRHCGKFILVRTRPSDRIRVLVTESQANEIEAQWREVQSAPPCQIFQKEGFDKEKLRLTATFGHEPSENDVTWSLLNKELLKHSSTQQWGLYRNTLFEMGEVLRAESKLADALTRYLEVCYLDLNGGNNYGSMSDLEREVLGRALGIEIKSFEPDGGELFPGVLYRVEFVVKELSLQPDPVRQRFLDVATGLQKALGLPLSPGAGWKRLQNELYPI